MVSGGATHATSGGSLLVGGAVHGQFAYVFLRLEDDDVHLGGEQTEEGD